jgi:hypothetical protein
MRRINWFKRRTPTEWHSLIRRAERYGYPEDTGGSKAEGEVYLDGLRDPGRLRVPYP